MADNEKRFHLVAIEPNGRRHTITTEPGSRAVIDATLKSLRPLYRSDVTLDVVEVQEVKGPWREAFLAHLQDHPEMSDTTENFAAFLVDQRFFQSSNKYRKITRYPEINGSALEFLRENQPSDAKRIEKDAERMMENQARAVLYTSKAMETIELDLHTFNVFRSIRRERGLFP